MSSLQAELPAGMWFYSFMFGDKKPLVGQFVAEGRVPEPSTLLLGLGIGVVLSAARLVLDLVVLKVGSCKEKMSGLLVCHVVA